MPLWTKLLAVALFTAFMAGYGWALREWFEPALGRFYDWAGPGIAWAVMLTILAVAAFVAYWPRRPDGSMRRLRSPWD